MENIKKELTSKADEILEPYIGPSDYVQSLRDRQCTEGAGQYEAVEIVLWERQAKY
jgi:hypothetical protein